MPKTVLFKKLFFLVSFCWVSVFSTDESLTVALLSGQYKLITQYYSLHLIPVNMKDFTRICLTQISYTYEQTKKLVSKIFISFSSLYNKITIPTIMHAVPGFPEPKWNPTFVLLMKGRPIKRRGHPPHKEGPHPLKRR